MQVKQVTIKVQSPADVTYDKYLEVYTYTNFPKRFFCHNLTHWMPGWLTAMPEQKMEDPAELSVVVKSEIIFYFFTIKHFIIYLLLTITDFSWLQV